MVLLDLQKAFDTLRFNSVACEGIWSYLIDRCQRVDINSILFEARYINGGVPQGRLLGPLLFLLYINDMKSVCDCFLFLYADKSALLVSHKDNKNVENQLSAELKNVWLCENKSS